MTRPYKFLSTLIHSSSTVVAESPHEPSVKSDSVLILAALICALVCVIGLIAVAYFTWLHRRSLANRSPVHPSVANKGIDKKLVEAIPKFTYDSGKEENANDCVICLGEYADGDEIRVLPQCGHRFHIRCIDQWLGSHSSCPSCRQIVVISNCKKCGEFSTIKDREFSLVAKHEGKQHNAGSCSINKVEGC